MYLDCQTPDNTKSRNLTKSKKNIILIQNEGTRAILWYNKDTAAAAMRFVLGMPAMNERHKLAQVKAYLKVCADTKHPLHNRVGRETKIRLKRN